MGQRLRKQQRIRKEKTFQRLFKEGKAARGKFLNLWAQSGLGQSQGQDALPNVGIIVSRKTSPKAVTRNLWKRRIREAFRKNQGRIKRGISILVLSKKKDRVPSLKDIETEMMTLLAKTESCQ